MIGGAAKVIPVTNDFLDFLALTDDELRYVEAGNASEFARSLRCRCPAFGIVETATIWNSLRVGLGFEGAL